jgi:hypothetical protein
MHSVRWLSRTTAGFLLCALVDGLLTWQLAALLPEPRQHVLECVGLPSFGPRQGLARVSLFSQSNRPASVDVHFLDVDDTIVGGRHLELGPRAETAFELPTWLLGVTMQVVTSAAVGVDLTLTYGGSVGPPDHRTVPCRPAGAPLATAAEPLPFTLSGPMAR